MKRFAFRLFAAVMLFSPAALAEETPPASVVVHVFNAADVTQWTLTEAGRELNRIFAEIGIGITWEVTSAFRSGDQPLTTSTDAAHVSINIIAKPMPDFPSHVRRNQDTMGWTPGDPAVSVRSVMCSMTVFKTSFRVASLTQSTGCRALACSPIASRTSWGIC